DITNHLRANNLLCNQQHGFTSGKSTTTNLLEAMEIWTKALSHNLLVDIIFMDYVKAFDTDPYECLLAQLATLGIRGGKRVVFTFHWFGKRFEYHRFH
ncbi:hypothetical protein Pcinc_006050, partial [Petrolisthes cinctipes]